ncbi:MAG: PcfJ domain-containing protein [Clostridia bacterium]|nr:PcfJ domain-containing protein [Clostridia bacterium]
MEFIRVCDEDRAGWGDAFFNMPDVPNEELLEVRGIFSHYIFYRREKGCVRGRCTCCGKEMVARKYDEGTFLGELWVAKDKETGYCPSCGEGVVYRSAGRFKDFSTLDCYRNVIFILPIHGGQTVFFRCYTVFANYHADGPVRLCFVEKAHYRLSQGEWFMERRTFPTYEPMMFDTLACYQGIYDRNDVGPWQARKRPCDPWQTYMWHYPHYAFMNMQKLQDTFLKYSRVRDFNRLRPKSGSYYSGGTGSTKLMAYLCYYTQYPTLEIALRTGGGEAARDLIYSHQKNARVVNWKARNPLEFWRVSKEEYRATEGLSDRLSFFKDCRQYFGRLPVVDLAAMYRDGERQVRAFFEILDMLEGEKPARLLRYCNTHSKQYFGFYKDYLEAAREIGRDITVHNVRYPKDLQRAHDEAVAARNYMRNEKQYAAWEKKARKYAKSDAKRRKFYDFAEGDYFVRVAKDGPEIVAEGNALGHCVGGYVDRHVTCKTTILFLRRVAEPDKPFYTVEMREGKLQQVHGSHNCGIKGEAKDFFDRWLAWLEAGGGVRKQTRRAKSTEREAG